ncbi:hypothetical protein AWB69_01384 [Caballeronia udeis]|uniref:Uncharacterized protein n=1 Tax=Caballeronia udeis TaxID=1232866 RepID=A0A158FMV2_9BURK|nr:hypothetical protein [Caballeronia udeis]SAL21075.1 hypothetical protein AWB69_01384 [Caballeronia udeis]
MRASPVVPAKPFIGHDDERACPIVLSKHTSTLDAHNDGNALESDSPVAA